MAPPTGHNEHSVTNSSPNFTQNFTIESPPRHRFVTARPSTVLAVEKVLVVDPDAEERRWIMRMLKRAGYQALEARGQAEALALVSWEPQALVIIAEETPPGPAPEFVAALRQATRAPIVVIGEEREVSQVAALLLGADYYDRRPLLPATVVARVRSLFRRWAGAEATPQQPLP